MLETTRFVAMPVGEIPTGNLELYTTSEKIHMNLNVIKHRCKILDKYFNLSECSKIIDLGNEFKLYNPKLKWSTIMSWTTLYDECIESLKKHLKSEEEIDVWFDTHDVE